MYFIAFSSEKLLSESGEKYAQIKQCLQVKEILNKCVSGLKCEKKTMNEQFHWRKRYYGLQTDILFLTNT